MPQNKSQQTASFQPEPQMPEKKPCCKLYWLVLILAAVIALGVSICVILTGNIELPSSQEVLWPERKTDEIADWQVYQNVKYGYEIKYPKGWVLEKLGDPYTKSYAGTGRRIVTAIDDAPVIRPKESELPEKLFILITAKNRDKSKDYQFIPPTPSGLPEENPVVERYGKNSFYYGVGTFEGQTDIVYEILNDDMSKVVSFDMIISGGRQKVDYYISKKEITSELNIFHQILSTFKFIESDEIADWQVYRNEELGYQIKYPKGWTIQFYHDRIENVEDINLTPVDLPLSQKDGEVNFQNVYELLNNYCIMSVHNLRAFKDESLEEVVFKWGGSQEYIQKEYLLVDNRQAVKLTKKIPEGINGGAIPGDVIVNVFVESPGSEKLKIQNESLQIQNCEAIFNQILSTFKFIK